MGRPAVLNPDSIDRRILASSIGLRLKSPIFAMIG